MSSFGKCIKCEKVIGEKLHDQFYRVGYIGSDCGEKFATETEQKNLYSPLTSCRQHKDLILTIKDYEFVAYLRENNYTPTTAFQEKSLAQHCLDLSQNKQLEKLIVRDNNFSPQNLSFLSHLVNLQDLYLGNLYSYGNKYNRFNGSLEPLKNMSRLNLLDISNTDIDSGLEYLPDRVNDFRCLANIKKDARLRYQARQLLKADFLQAKDQQIQKLEEELQLERETNQESAEIMDDFYRMAPPREDLALKNILEKISEDYLELSLENRELKKENEKLRENLELIKELAEAKIDEQQTQISQQSQQLQAKIQE
ncbi:6868_t:CDS:2, partial [Entrophospora sp. SA101]